MNANTGSLALLIFGALALIGLVVLAATGHLNPAVQDTLTAIAAGAMTGLGVHVAHTTPTVTAPPDTTTTVGLGAGGGDQV